MTVLLAATADRGEQAHRGRARPHDRGWPDRRIGLLADPTALGQLDEVALIDG